MKAENQTDTPRQKEAQGFRQELGFSFVSFQDANQEAIDFSKDTIKKAGLIGRIYNPRDINPPDGNISTNFFEDLNEYGNNSVGYLTVWRINASTTRDGLFKDEQQIKPRASVSEETAQDLHVRTEANPELHRYWPIMNLRAHLKRVFFGFQPRNVQTRVPEQTHVVLPPENLVAILDIPVEKRKQFFEFYVQLLPELMKNPREEMPALSERLAELLQASTKPEFIANSWSLKQLAEEILKTLYFAELRNMARRVTYEPRQVELISEFNEVGSLDQISDRYISLVKTRLNDSTAIK